MLQYAPQDDAVRFFMMVSFLVSFLSMSLTCGFLDSEKTDNCLGRFNFHTPVRSPSFDMVKCFLHSMVCNRSVAVHTAKSTAWWALFSCLISFSVISSMTIKGSGEMTPSPLWHALLISYTVIDLPVQFFSCSTVFKEIVYPAMYFPIHFLVEQLQEKSFLSYLVEGLGQVRKDSEYPLLLKGIFNQLGKVNWLIFCATVLLVS